MAGNSYKLRRNADNVRRQVPAKPKREQWPRSFSSISDSSSSTDSLSLRSPISAYSQASTHSDRSTALKKTRKPKRAAPPKRAKTAVYRKTKTDKRPSQRRATSETRKGNTKTRSTVLANLKDEKDLTLRELFHDVVAELMTRKGQNTTLHYVRVSTGLDRADSASELSLASEKPSLGPFPALNKVKSHGTTAQSWTTGLTPSATSTRSRSSTNLSAATKSSSSRASIAQKSAEAKSPLEQAKNGKKNVSFSMYGPEHARWMKLNEDAHPVIPRDIRPPPRAISGMFKSQLAKYRTAAEVKKDQEKAAAALKALKESDGRSGNDDPGWYESTPVAGLSKAAASVDQSTGVPSVSLAPAVQPVVVQPAVVHPIAGPSGVANQTAASVSLAPASQATPVSVALVGRSPSKSPALPESPVIVGPYTEVPPKPIVRKRSDSFKPPNQPQNAEAPKVVKRFGVSQQLVRFGLKVVPNKSKDTAVELSDRTPSPISRETSSSASEKAVSAIALAHAASPAPLETAMSPGPMEMNNNGSSFVPLAHSTPMPGSSRTKRSASGLAARNSILASSDTRLPRPAGQSSFVNSASPTSPVFKTPSRPTSSKWLVKAAENMEEAYEQGKQVVLSPHPAKKSASPAAAQVTNDTFATAANASASSQGTFATPRNVSASIQDNSPTFVTALDTSNRSDAMNISDTTLARTADRPTTSGGGGAGRFKHRKNIHLCMMVDKDKPMEADCSIRFESSHSKPTIRITQLYVDDQPLWSTRSSKHTDSNVSATSPLASSSTTSTSSSSSQQRGALRSQLSPSTSSTFTQNSRDGSAAGNGEATPVSSRLRRRRSDLKTRREHKNH